MASVEERLQRLEDQIAIYQTVCGYGYSVDGLNQDALGEIYAEDGVYAVADTGGFNGRAAVQAITKQPQLWTVNNTKLTDHPVTCPSGPGLIVPILTTNCAVQPAYQQITTVPGGVGGTVLPILTVPSAIPRPPAARMNTRMRIMAVAAGLIDLGGVGGVSVIRRRDSYDALGDAAAGSTLGVASRSS